MSKRAIITGAAGGAIAIAIMELLSARSMTPLMTIPFATLIVLVMGSPEAEPAAALAVGLAILAMQLTGTFHPPAGINPLLVVVNNFSWSFIAVPVACGVLLLLGFAYVWNNFVRGSAWPHRWW